jgi:hypothetical protein
LFKIRAIYAYTEYLAEIASLAEEETNVTKEDPAIDPQVARQGRRQLSHYIRGSIRRGRAEVYMQARRENMTPTSSKWSSSA